MNHELMVQIGSFWFTLMFCVFIYGTGASIRLRHWYSRGRISDRRYAITKRELRARCWRAVALVTMVAGVVGGVGYAVNP